MSPVRAPAKPGILFVSAWVSSGCSGFPHNPKNMQCSWIGDGKFVCRFDCICVSPKPSNGGRVGERPNDLPRKNHLQENSWTVSRVWQEVVHRITKGRMRLMVNECFYSRICNRILIAWLKIYFIREEWFSSWLGWKRVQSNETILVCYVDVYSALIYILHSPCKCLIFFKQVLLYSCFLSGTSNPVTDQTPSHWTSLSSAFFFDQDQFENLDKHTQWGIDFLERYAKFVKERLEIEQTYAKQLRWASNNTP